MYPVYFLSFWYKDGVRGVLFFNTELNSYLTQLLSFPALLSTFNHPLKNEYRKDLVFFSILLGMAVKSTLIIIDILVMLFVIVVEAAFFVLYISAPLLPILLFML